MTDEDLKALCEERIRLMSWCEESIPVYGVLVHMESPTINNVECKTVLDLLWRVRVAERALQIASRQWSYPQEVIEMWREQAEKEIGK